MFAKTYLICFSIKFQSVSCVDDPILEGMILTTVTKLHQTLVQAIT